MSCSKKSIITSHFVINSNSDRRREISLSSLVVQIDSDEEDCSSDPTLKRDFVAKCLH